ncbi:Phage major capsid protein [Xanthomonas phage Suba]|uniref:Phage major capsid protein n=1 Tax=Xanthomonas phage Suba TaxID=2674975 RepID=A0A679KLC0_9CAUD|nr:Phage major capsid protein [Xanthomonas phage Suba]CAA2409739.1 Phage major capsid protein [Xanthomonas phage Suba]
MALSDLKVYSETAYSVATEILQEQTDLFNAASNGAIVLGSAAHQGDFSEIAFFQKIAGGTVRRRNPYGNGDVAMKSLAHIADVMVKVASGTFPIDLSPAQFRWIQLNPQVAGAAFGQQLAKDTMADMLRIGLGSAHAAVVNQGRMLYDATTDAANTTPDSKTMTWLNQAKAAALFGDASDRIRVWAMHSGASHKLYQNNLMNVERLFNFGTVNVMRDPMGRVILVSDNPSLVTPAAGQNPAKFHSLGLGASAIVIQQNNDFDANEETKNGKENIQRTYQAEWSYQLGLDGYSWDKQTGGKAPTDAALLSGANWDQHSTSDKDTLGVVLETN